MDDWWIISLPDALKTTSVSNRRHWIALRTDDLSNRRCMIVSRTGYLFNRRSTIGLITASFSNPRSMIVRITSVLYNRRHIIVWICRNNRNYFCLKWRFCSHSSKSISWKTCWNEKKTKNKKKRLFSFKYETVSFWISLM